MLTILIDDKLGCISVRLESEFFSDETEFNIRLVSVTQLAKDSNRTQDRQENSRFANIAQRSKPFTNNKHIHKIRTHVRGVKVKLEKLMIVAQRQR